MMSAGRPKVFDEAEALSKAIDLFWKNGYEATTTEKLQAAMKMGKGSMYHNFGGKKEVFKMAVDKYFSDFVSYFSKELATTDDPVKFIQQFFRSLATQSLTDHKKGCFMGNIMAELSIVDPSLEKKAIEVMKQFEAILKKEIIKAQQNGLLKSKEDPTQLSRYLLNLWNGINITRRMYPSGKELIPLIDFQLQRFY